MLIHSRLFKVSLKSQQRCKLFSFQKRFLSENSPKLREVLSHEEFEKLKPDGVTLIRTPVKAKQVVSQLQKLKDHYHACDTEVIDIDLDKSVIGQGKVICASIFVGPQFDFGSGPRIWIDNFEECEGVLNEFKPYFGDKSIKKVFHNFSFDKHVLENSGIKVHGFGGDTMQIARLWDSSKMMSGGYSLKNLTGDPQLELPIQAKRTIEERFGSPKIKKDGTEGKIVVIPPFTDLQRERKFIKDWIDYSAFDAESTWYLREALERELKKMPWRENLNMWDFYLKEWLPFGELLTEIEKEGIRVDVEHLKKIEIQAKKDSEQKRIQFLTWAQTKCPDVQYMNIESDAQKQQFFFAPAFDPQTGEELLAKTKEFKRENTEGYIEPGAKKAKKQRSFYLTGLQIPFTEVTASGKPSVNGNVLRTLAGRNPLEGMYGTAYETIGAEGCIAIDALIEAEKINTLLTSFIIPLQELTDSKERIHTSLNVNTETGRLSSRKPNLQNQPALEKDRYKIREAFTCDPGNSLIVADYGQLELRLLAHITNCKSMLEAFKIGGDFHSRTAMGMYPEIAEAVNSGKVLLEWDYKKGTPPAPLLKDIYASQRRRAKTLNFSIAYGKTAVGLSKDWNTSKQEAEETLQKWFKDRPEVKLWQEKTIEMAKKTKYTRTLLGRYRKLPDIDSRSPSLRNHSQRAAINTPLQGGAADVVTRAMVLLSQNPSLKELGWKQILQIHDEIILEGPEKTSQEALDLVKQIMKSPFWGPNEELLVNLEVDAKIAKNWFAAK